MQIARRLGTWIAVPMLAVSLAASQQKPESARELLERGHYEEEHTRDFAKAAELFAQAETAARASKDEATARAAGQAIARVRARASGAHGAQQQAADEPIAIRIIALIERVACLDVAAFDENGRLAVRDLALYGDAAVPFVLGNMTGHLGYAGVRKLGPTAIVIALVTIGTEAAKGEIERLARSSDPLMRRAIARYVEPAQAALIARLVEDPVPAVRDDALSRLVQHDLADHGDVMRRAGREGRKPAFQWLARHAPEALIEIARDVAAPGRLVATAELARIVNTVTGSPLGLRAISTLLENARAQDEQVAKAAVDTLLSGWHGGNEARNDAISDLVDAEVGRHVERYPASTAQRLLIARGRAASIEPFTRTLEHSIASGDVDAWSWIPRNLEQSPALTQARDAAEFETVLRCMVRVDALVRSKPEVGQAGADLIKAFAPGLFAADAKIRSASALADAWAKCSPTAKEYLGQMIAWQVDVTAPARPDAALVPALRELATSEDSATRFRAGYALARTLDVESLFLVLDAVWQNGVFPRVEAFLAADPERAAKMLVERMRADALREPRAHSKYLPAICRLPDAQHAAAVEALWPALTRDSGRAVLASNFVGVCAAPACNAVALAIFDDLHDPSGDAQVRAIRNFAAALYEPAIPKIGECLRSESYDVRTAAQEALATFKKHREALAEFETWTHGDREARAAIDELVKLLASDNDAVAIGAANSLAAIKAKAALPALVKRLENASQTLANTIHKAIASIGG